MRRTIVLWFEAGLWHWKVQTQAKPRARWKVTSTGSATWTGVTRDGARRFVAGLFGIDPSAVEVLDGQ